MVPGETGAGCCGGLGGGEEAPSGWRIFLNRPISAWIDPVGFVREFVSPELVEGLCFDRLRVNENFAQTYSCFDRHGFSESNRYRFKSALSAD